MHVLWLTVVVFGISACAVSATQSAANSSGDQILSRRRRYLIFPDGSSLQLVYDQIIPIVDKTNYLIMGVTVALAWRLPDQPDFREKTESDENRKNFQINRKHDNKTTTVITDDHRPYHVHNDRKHYHDHRITLDYQNYLIEKSKQPQNHATSNWNHAKWYSVADKDANKFRHRIYPVLLKRRAITWPKDKQDDMHRHLEHHRRSRFSLYQAIAKYLDARGHSGEECIQMAICETTMRSGAPMKHDSSANRPHSFLKELMRAIFSLPTSFLTSNPTNATKLYDAANNIDGVDCAKTFPKCSHSIWSEDFIF